jgi:bifunctional DNA-binding transcriptional regulator/antitoxin component of YhaV-PrlF toxin-antitoxin module
MKRVVRQPTTFSKVSFDGHTVIPRKVCKRLKLKPGDTLRYRMIDDGILLDKAPDAGPFAVFIEWKFEADERAYSGL